MEYDVEELINDLNLPRDVLQEDMAKGRLLVYQHNGDERYYVEADLFLDYMASRVVELRPDQQKVFWLAVKKMMMDPRSPRPLSPEEIAAVMVAIEREIAKCS